MRIYVVLYAIIVLLCFFEQNVSAVRVTRNYVIKSKNVSFVVIYLYILIMGVFRSENLGWDTETYYNNYFLPFSKMTPMEVIRYDNDWGYGLLNWVISRFTNDYWIFRAIVFALVFTSISIWIRKNSQLVSLSYLAFLCFGYSNVCFYLLRLSVAVSIVIWSYKYLIDRKAVKYYVVIIFAILFHKSALFMIIMYPIMGGRFKNLKLLARVGILVSFVAVSMFGAGLVVRLYGRNDYSTKMNSGNGYSMLLYLCAIVLLLWFVQRGTDIKERERKEGLLLGIIYPQILATAVSIAARLTKYTGCYLFVMLPQGVRQHERNKGNVILVIMVVLLSVLFMRSTLTSDFFPYYTHFQA